jgi:calmodulin-regulated spectrin-associated protein
MALDSIYTSTSFTQLNHWGVIQALNRKGVYVGKPGDVALTETVLIQTNPIKMVSHDHPKHVFFFFFF